MPDPKKDIIKQLQKDILSLQGFKNLPADITFQSGLGPVELAFPNACFPLAAIHEFVCEGPEFAAATSGFISCVVSALLKTGGVGIWISTNRTLFPPALKNFGIDPHKLVFIDLHQQKDLLWVMEEALKCTGIAAVVCEMAELSFTASRRLQLAVEQSRVTGFIIRNQPRFLTVNACMAGWKIAPLPTILEDDLPGIGFPRWKVELFKIRNGKPGTWEIEWSQGQFQHIYPWVIAAPEEEKRKAG
jgi:protein ImuA